MPKRPIGWEKKSNPANQTYKLTDMPSPAWCKDRGHRRGSWGILFSSAPVAPGSPPYLPRVCSDLGEVDVEWTAALVNVRYL
jgi:hypothetical protein